MNSHPKSEHNLPPGSGFAIAFLFALVFWAVVATGLSVAVLRQGAAPAPPSTQDLM